MSAAAAASTAGSGVRGPSFPPTAAQPAPVAAAAPAPAAATSTRMTNQQSTMHSQTATAAATAATKPAGNQTSVAASNGSTQANHSLQQQQSHPSQSSQPSQLANTIAPPPPASTAAAVVPSSSSQPHGHPSSSSSSSTTSSSTPSGFIPFSLRPPLPLSSRSRFKTFILSQGVFEVEGRYVLREVIGQGAYGVVVSALDLKTGRMVAIKKIENVFDHRSLAKRTLRELQIVRSLPHENILGLERVVRPHSAEFKNVYMISELMETDLACVIRSPQELTEAHSQFFIYQVLRGLKFIHSANVIHRDLKPRNLLVNSNCDLKICDFGLARHDDPLNRDRVAMSNYIATRWYRAPEVILSSPSSSASSSAYGKPVDMWAVGCILAELLGRKPIFPGRDSFHQITLICSILGTPTEAAIHSATKKQTEAAAANNNRHASSSSSSAVSAEYLTALPKKPKVPFRALYPHASASACDLLDRLLVFEPERRLTVEEALSHPFLEDLHSEEDEPVCTHFNAREFDWEHLKTSKEDLRYLIHEEITKHYPEEDFDPHSAQALLAMQKAGLVPKGASGLDTMAQMGGALPPQRGKKNRTRRKSI